jgi:hypothetical protein
LKLEPTIYYYTTDAVGLIGSGTQQLAINAAKMESLFLTHPSLPFK